MDGPPLFMIGPLRLIEPLDDVAHRIAVKGLIELARDVSDVRRELKSEVVYGGVEGGVEGGGGFS